MTNKTYCNRVIAHIKDWIKRCTDYAREDKDSNKEEEWKIAKKVFDNFSESYKRNKYYDNLSWDFQFKVTHDVIKSLKCDKKNYWAVDTIFTFWDYMKMNLKEDSDRFILYDATQYMHNFTTKNKKLCKLKEELEKLNTQEYTEYSYSYLKYRDIVGIMDNFGCANIIVNNEIKSFPIEWDWWFNIDHYLDLEVGWKK